MGALLSAPITWNNNTTFDADPFLALSLSGIAIFGAVMFYPFAFLRTIGLLGGLGGLGVGVGFYFRCDPKRAINDRIQDANEYLPDNLQIPFVPNERIEPGDHTPQATSKFRIKTECNQWLSAKRGVDRWVYTVRTPNDWEEFTKVDQDDGTVGFRTHHGTYLSATNNGAWPHPGRLTTAGGISTWEKFTIVQHGGMVALKTCHATYLSVNHDHHDRYVICKNHCRAWELFVLEPVA